MWPEYQYDVLHEQALLMKFQSPESAFAKYRTQVSQAGVVFDAWASVESGEKLPYGITLEFIKSYVRRWREFWPDSMIFHVIRNPNDVAASCKRTFKRGENARLVSEKVEAMSEWLEQFPNVHELHYGDLLADPSAYLEYVYGFLGKVPDYGYIHKVITTKDPWKHNGRIMCGLRYHDKITRVNHG